MNGHDVITTMARSLLDSYSPVREVEQLLLSQHHREGKVCQQCNGVHWCFFETSQSVHYRILVIFIIGHSDIYVHVYSSTGRILMWTLRRVKCVNSAMAYTGASLRLTSDIHHWSFRHLRIYNVHVA